MAIKSFEVSNDGQFGDMLSKKNKEKKNKLKVGVICVGWFEWYGMFPDSNLEKMIVGDAKNFINNFKKKANQEFDIIYPGMIDTLNSANSAGRILKKENVDVIIIVENTYVTDYIIMEVLDYIPNVPILLISTQASGNLEKNMTNLDVIRYEALVGNTQITGAFKKIGKSYDVICGPLDDNNLYKRIYEHLKIFEIKNKLKRYDFGLLGHTFRGMYDLEADKTKIKGVFGSNIFYIDVQHFLNIWDGIKYDDVSEYKRVLEKEIPIKKFGINEEDMEKSIRVAISMAKLVKRFNLDGLSVLGQHHVEKACKSSVDFSFFEVERNGCVTTHEGDLGNLVLKRITYDLSGDLPIFLEWSAFDIKTNTILLSHHGVVNPLIYASSLDNCRWTPSPEKWDITGNGLSIEYTGKEGSVTLFSLIDEKDGWKVVISKGKCLQLEKRPCFAPQFYFNPNKEVTKFLEVLLKNGVAHHVIMIYGDYKEKMEIIMDYLKVKTIYI